MANNNLIFDAAYSGAVAGIEGGRSIANTSALSYNAIRLAALRFANAIDGLIAPSNDFLQQDAQLLQNICAQVCSGRHLTDTSNVTVTAQAIVALWNQTRGDLLNPAPFVVQNLNYDGQANLLQTVIGAPHTPGMYIVTGVIDVITVVAAGMIFRHAEWYDPRHILDTWDNPTAVAASNPGVQPNNESTFTIITDGLHPVTIEWQPGGVTPGFVGDVYCSAVFTGRLS